jgi:hypothetical protein
MRIAIAGGSGFLGRSLTSALLSGGHHVQVLTRQTVRHAQKTPDGRIELVNWTPDGTLGPWATSCAGADIVINLAGESIGKRRWSATRKAELITSRLLPTRSLVSFIEGAVPPPSAFLSASAVGFYGNRGDETLTEDATEGRGFLADLAWRWEQEALNAESDTTRVVFLRTGMVLDTNDGALQKLIPPFKLFGGGPFGTGRQHVSWIHRDDWVSLVQWVIGSPGVRGPVNLTAPRPLTSAEFASALGRALHRPARMTIPAVVLKLVFGEMAEQLLLFSQRVIPARAQAGGFRFAFETIDEALGDLLQ